MIPIKEIVEIPFAKTTLATFFIFFCVVPANLFFYYFDHSAFERIDFLKLIILTIGSGTAFTMIASLEGYITFAQYASKEATEEELITSGMLIGFIIILISIAVTSAKIDMGSIKTINRAVRELINTHISAMLGINFLFFIYSRWPRIKSLWGSRSSSPDSNTDHDN